MTKEELEKEAEELIQRVEIGNSMNCFMQLTPDRKQIVEMLVMIAEPREKRIIELEKENAELKKNFEESLIACGVLKEKIEILSKPSPLESMQDALITTQKVVYEKKKEQLAKAKEIIKSLLPMASNFVFCTLPKLDEELQLYRQAEQFVSEVEK